MSVLVIAEHDNQQLKAATLHTVSAAAKIHSDIHILVVGSSCASVCETASQVRGVTRVLSVDSTEYGHLLAESVAPLIASIAENYTHILAPATTTGKNILPRAAALKDCQPISDVVSVINDNTFKRPIYAGNVIATVESADKIKFLTVRATAFDAAQASGGSANIVTMEGDAQDAQSLSTFDSHELAESDRPELTAASIVVSGGRGLQSSENFDLLYHLADSIGAAVGASRAAVDAGFVPNDLQVGQTGKIVAPELYIAVGISGAIQHLAGMKDSRIIVAINKDEDAPIFQVADYGLVADLFDVIPELTKQLSA